MRLKVTISEFFLATQFLKTENFVANSLFLRKQFAKKRQKTGFFTDGVTTCMPPGYSFQSFLK
jgi:hypothetical protein